MATIIINKGSLEEQMMEDFILELNENKTLLERCGDNAFIKQRAIERVRIIEASIEELKKQIADPIRHYILKEGINPANRAAYEEQYNEIK
jgi:hypothetical protein